MDLQLVGAGSFGMLIGWYVYYINRYRRAEVQFSDLVTVIGIIGGGAVLELFEAGTDLFGAYGLGLGIGFFGYFIVLLILVAASPNFEWDWFLDGRRAEPQPPWKIPDHARQTGSAMGVEGGGHKPQV